MTADQFRRMALSLPEATESAHMGHPDFRVKGKIFATLDYPEPGWGMVKLTPEQQAVFVRSEPEVFQPCTGGWGKRGCTTVCLEAADESSLRQALTAAWRNVAPKKVAAGGQSPSAGKSAKEQPGLFCNRDISNEKAIGIYPVDVLYDFCNANKAGAVARITGKLVEVEDHSYHPESAARAGAQ